MPHWYVCFAVPLLSENIRRIAFFGPGDACIVHIWVIINKNPIFAVLCLIGLIGSISIYLIFIGLTFIGLAYIIIYIGAVSILFLFIVMLIDIRVSELQNDNRDSMPLALYIGLIFSNFILLDEIKSTGTYFVRGLLLYLDNNNTKSLGATSGCEAAGFEKTYLQNLFFVSSNNWDNNVLEISHITSIGSVQYSIYGLWLIISSLVLLLAMVGAISIVINRDYSDNSAIMTRE